MVGYLLTSLLQIYCRVWWWKNFENRLAFRGVTGENNVALFFRTRCSTNDSGIFAHPPLIYRESKPVYQIWLQFSTLVVAVEALWFTNRATHRTSKNIILKELIVALVTEFGTVCNCHYCLICHIHARLLLELNDVSVSVSVLFTRSWELALTMLRGKTGAKELFNNYQNHQ